MKNSVVTAALIRETRRSPADIKAEMLAQVAALQAESVEAVDPAALVRGIADPCIVMLDQLMPPLAPPTLPQCAAALSLAYADLKGTERQSDAGKNLAVFSAVLDDRARTEMKADGKTEAESDIVIGLEKEKLMAEYKAHHRSGQQDKIDYQACFDMARP